MVAALLAHKANPNARVESWTPTRRSSRDWNFNPELVGATPYWLAARAMAPSVMRLLAQHGADTHIVHKVAYHAGDPPAPRSQKTTAIMAAVGMGGGIPWVNIDRNLREPLVLEAVKLAVELGADLNVVNDDGRSALDAAKAARYESVVEFLTGKGAKPGLPNGRPAGRAAAGR